MAEKYIVKSLEDTKKLAEKIASEVKPGSVVLLHGTLGAGKTYFSSCFINWLLAKNGLPKVDVASPTFNIVKEYQAGSYSIYHFDLYRLKNKNELYELDIETAFEAGVCLIEWPEMGEGVIYNVAFEIDIEITGENERVFSVEKRG